MTSPIRLRTRSLKIPVTESDAAKIVIPLVNVTAYILSIHYTIEMPQVQAFSNAIKDSKTRLASLLSSATMLKVRPEELNTISVEVLPCGGYFKVSLTRNYVANGKDVIQGYKLSLQCKTGMTLLGKLQFIGKQLNPDSSTDQVIQETVDAMKRMGL